MWVFLLEPAREGARGRLSGPDKLLILFRFLDVALVPHLLHNRCSD
jgi:hypothetical protein